MLMKSELDEIRALWHADKVVPQLLEHITEQEMEIECLYAVLCWFLTAVDWDGHNASAGGIPHYDWNEWLKKAQGLMARLSNVNEKRT